MENLYEAFEALKVLDEDVFDATEDGFEKASEFIETSEETPELVDIIDPLAETEEELQDSYEGKVILDCVICQSKIYADPSDVIFSEDGSLVNVGESCPYCQSTDGYKVIGQVAPYVLEEEKPEEEKEEVKETETKEIEIEEPKEDKKEEKEEIEESIKTRRGLKKLKAVQEDFNKVEIETDKEKMSMVSDDAGKVTVTTEPKCEECAEEKPTEMIAPVEPEVEAEFKSEEEEVEEEPEYKDIEIDEFEEKDFDELGEKYLRRVYENVKSYKTTQGSIKGNQLKLEGIITFKSGKQAKTNFVFESTAVTKTGKVKFVGLNEQFAKGKKTFVLTGSVNDKKLTCESLQYNYKAKDVNGTESKRLYGRVVK